MRRLIAGALAGVQNAVVNPSLSGSLRRLCSWTPPHHLPEKEHSNDAELVSDILVSQHNPFHAMEASLQLLGVSLSSHLLNQTLLRLTHNTKIALAFFHYCKSLPGARSPVSAASYDILVDALGRVRQFDVVWQLIAEMPPNNQSSAFLILVRRLIAAGLTRQAVRAFHDMEAFVGPATTSSSSRSDQFHFLIDTLCKYGHVKLAVEIFNKNRNVFLAGVKTYTVLIYGWCKINRRDMAERFLQDMIANGIEPNVVTYNVLLNGICRRASLHPEERFSRTIKSAQNLFDEMRQRGIEPDATSFSVVIHVFSRAHKPDLTMEKLTEMRGSGLSPTVATYTSVIKCLCSCGRFEKAEAVLAEMEKDGITPCGETYNCFFKEYRGRNDVDGALSLYRKMSSPASVRTYNVLVGLFVRANRADLVKEIWGDMRASGVGPDLDSYTMAVHGFCDRQRWREACEVFVEMIERGFLPQKVTFEMLYRGLIQADMLRTWRRLKKRLDHESITFGSEFDAYELRPYKR